MIIATILHWYNKKVQHHCICVPLETAIALVYKISLSVDFNSI